MKNILRVNQASHTTDLALLMARIGIGLLMLTHGLPKLIILFSGEPVQFPGLFGLSAELSLGLTVFAEVLCSIFLIAGLGTRMAVLPLMTVMLVAVLYVHAADAFAKQEPGLQYLLVYVVLLLAGSGRYSIDYLLQPKTVTSGYAN